MSIPLPLELLLNQGGVFLHYELDLEETTRTKFIIYLSHPIFLSPLFFVLTTTDKNRRISSLPKALQDEILVIPQGELEFFKDADHTLVDLNNHRDIQGEKFEEAIETAHQIQKLIIEFFICFFYVQGNAPPASR